MEKPDYRAWFESTRESNQATIDQTETIFEGLVAEFNLQMQQNSD